MGRKKAAPKEEPAVDSTPEPTVEPAPVAETEPEVPPVPAPPPGEDEITKLKEQLAAAQLEASQNLENWQRPAAELANFKRRQEEQLKLQRDRLKSEVLQGVISAMDDMDLAFQNVPPELNGQLLGWVEGFRLVQRKLDKVLDEQNVMTVNSTGKFDPNFHEAISYEDSEHHETDDIIAELRKGYQIGNRVIRPALVRVAS
jgi:molecular chaperone GrpE